jgi:hypothetical protein
VAEERDFDERLATIARELVNEPDMQQPGAGEEAGQELGAVLHPFERVFTSAVSSAMSCFRDLTVGVTGSEGSPGSIWPCHAAGQAS